MKYRLKALLIGLLLFLPMLGFVIPAGQAGAVNVFTGCNGGASTSDVCKDQAASNKGGTNPIITALKVAITIVSIIIGVAAVITIVVGSIGMITSGGDPQSVAKARGAIVYALIGIVVAVLAESIVAFVLNKL